MAQINFSSIQNYLTVNKVNGVNEVKYENGGADARITRNLLLSDAGLEKTLGQLAAEELRKQELNKLNISYGTNNRA